MTLLDHYLKAVRMYLPKGPQQDDIITELAEHLQSKIEEREAALGRPLSEVEQEALLTQHGNPMFVAARYGATSATSRSVAFGRQLIGPELFPLYARILVLNWGLTIVALFAIAAFVDTPIPTTPRRFLFPLLVQLVIVTVIFAFIDKLQRRSRGNSARLQGHNWRFPPAYLQPIPRWQSVSGLVILGTAALWWIAVPNLPALLLGRAADVLELAPSWGTLYWPALLLLLLGIAQRATTLVRPDLNWLQAVTRLITNGFGVALLYPFVLGYPYVTVADAALDVAAADLLARRINGAIWWVTLATFSLYWLINAGFHAWLCVQHVRYVMRCRSEAVR